MGLARPHRIFSGMNLKKLVTYSGKLSMNQELFDKKIQEFEKFSFF